MPDPKILLALPETIAKHPYCTQLARVKDEENLRDAVILFRDEYLSKFNRCLLCIISPVFHKMFCGDFIERTNDFVELDDIDAELFTYIVDLACGETHWCDLEDAVTMCTLADRLEISHVQIAIETALLQHLTVENCTKILNLTAKSNLSRIYDAALQFALNEFQGLSESECFLDLKESVLGMLLDEDRLSANGEDRILLALIRWMKASPSRLQSENLLSKIRFGIIPYHLISDFISEIPESQILKDISAKHNMKENASPFSGNSMLGPPHFRPRIGTSPRWEKFANAGEAASLPGHTHRVVALAKCSGYVCSGSFDGTIRVWDGSSKTEKKVIRENDESCRIWSLSAWGRFLVSGHGLKSGGGRIAAIKVWEVETGLCAAKLDGHTDCVHALAPSCNIPSLLLSASDDKTVRVWKSSTGDALTTFTCEQILAGHKDGVRHIALDHGGTGAVISGDSSGEICIWDYSRNVSVLCLRQKLREHKQAITGLTVHQGFLFSVSSDNTLRVWDTCSWAEVQKIDVFGADVSLFPHSLTCSGTWLVVGSRPRYGTGKTCLKIWALTHGQQISDGAAPKDICRSNSGETATSFRRAARPGVLGTCEHSLPLKEYVSGLLAFGRELWGGVGNDVHVWSAL